MEIEIYSHYNMLAFDMMGARSLGINQEAEVIPGVRLMWQGTKVVKSFDIPSVTSFALEVGAGVTAGVVGNWLWSKLNNRKVIKLVIERREIKLDEGKIKEIIEERFQIEE